MEDLIMKIIDIEDRAQEVIKDAKKADRELEERIKDESRKMRDDITRRMEPPITLFVVRTSPITASFHPPPTTISNAERK